MKNFLIGLLVVLMVVIVAVVLFGMGDGAAAFETYTNDRFGYTLEYPSELTAEGEPANEDGQVFSGVGVDLEVFGTNDVQNQTLEEIALSYLDNPEAVEVTTDTEAEFIARVMDAQETTVVKAIVLGDGQVGILELTYEAETLSDDTVEHIIDSFEPVETSGDVADDETETVEGFTRYSNDELGFSILVPESAMINRPTENRVRVRLIGSGSEEGSEITDGIFFTVFNDPAARGYTDLENYAEAVYARTDEAEGGPVTDLEARSVAEMTAYRYRYETALGTIATSYIFLPAPGEGYVVTYSISEPLGQDRNYEEIVLTMLESIEFAASDDDDTAVDTETVQIALLDYAAVGDRFARESDGEERGCDRVVLVEREVPETEAVLTAALEELFSLEDTEVEGWQNFIAQVNDTLSFDRATVVDGTANIYLTGELTGLGGVCDNPRAAIQITETAEQFATVEDVQLYLNGEPTDLIPSGRG